METENQSTKRSFEKGFEFLEKWVGFTKFHKFIDKVDIIPFKCPLKTEFDVHLNEEEHFHFKEVYDFSVEQNRPITDIIDLTFTDRYYNPQEEDFALTKIVHHKFKIPGREVPSQEILQPIFDRMDELLQANKVIGVHCTHGLNRTGYLICAYMIQRLGWEPKEAIEAFESARGRPMEYQEYTDAVLALKRDDKEQEEGGNTQ